MFRAKKKKQTNKFKSAFRFRHHTKTVLLFRKSLKPFTFSETNLKIIDQSILLCGNGIAEIRNNTCRREQVLGMPPKLTNTVTNQVFKAIYSFSPVFDSPLKLSFLTEPTPSFHWSFTLSCFRSNFIDNNALTSCSQFANHLTLTTILS